MNRVRTTLVELAIALLLALVMAACASGDGSGETTPAATSCEAAPFQPTYLPWGKEDPNEPVRSTRDKDVVLAWSGRSADGKGKAAVSLVTRHVGIEGDELDEFPSAKVRDTRGWLVWVGDPGVGELTLLWEESVEPCGSYELHLLDEALSQKEAENEIKRIAGSLR